MEKGTVSLTGAADALRTARVWNQTNLGSNPTIRPLISCLTLGEVLDLPEALLFLIFLL